ncbi:transposase [Nitrosomonas sp. Nm132]|uniref:transposase n=1 Tax=Nitrosomonas sp. Nm132 TaxID=1881053 RepID=UPI000882A83B|nr:transposase [Nitrosomonas sp. Nm132]SDH04811.1 Transposase and inactivated derivatives [Nitrosomonas sp. Nm132]
MMQKSYSKEFKESVIKKMMLPNGVSVPQLCKETGVSDVTLYQWRKEYRNRGIAVPGDNSKADDWTAEVKLAVANISNIGVRSRIKKSKSRV